MLLKKRYYKNILASSLVCFGFVACKNKDKQKENNDIDGYASFDFKHGSEKVVAKKNEAILEILGDGRVIVVDGGNGKKTDFVLGSIDDLQKFANALKGKENIRIDDGSWDFRFFYDDVRICGHRDGFNIPEDRFEDFLNCLVSLSKFGKDLEIPKLPLSVVSGEVYLNDHRFKDDYYKNSEFWSLVKEHADLFKIDKGGKFEIENDNGYVNIGSLKSFLVWDDVVNESVVKSEWNKIFKLKDVRIKWIDKGFLIVDKRQSKVINSLEDLEDWVDFFGNKNVKAEGVEKFKLNFVTCGMFVSVYGGKEFMISCSDDFEKLLKCISFLKSRKAISNAFTIKIGGSNVGYTVDLNDVQVDTLFLKKKKFWNAIKKYKGLFKGLPIKVSKDTNSAKGKIGSSVLKVEVFDSKGNIKNEWEGVFEKKS